jgi:hypothetical protein
VGDGLVNKKCLSQSFHLGFILLEEIFGALVQAIDMTFRLLVDDLAAYVMTRVDQGKKKKSLGLDIAICIWTQALPPCIHNAFRTYKYKYIYI